MSSLSGHSLPWKCEFCCPFSSPCTSWGWASSDCNPAATAEPRLKGKCRKVGCFSKGIEMSAQLQGLIWVVPQESGRAGCSYASVPSAQWDTQGITEPSSSPEASGLYCTLLIQIELDNLFTWRRVQWLSHCLYVQILSYTGKAFHRFSFSKISAEL